MQTVWIKRGYATFVKTDIQQESRLQDDPLKFKIMTKRETDDPQSNKNRLTISKILLNTAQCAGSITINLFPVNYQ